MRLASAFLLMSSVVVCSTPSRHPPRPERPRDAFLIMVHNATPHDLAVALVRHEGSYRLGLVPSFERRTFWVYTAIARGDIWLEGVDRGRTMVTRSPIVHPGSARHMQWKLENRPHSLDIQHW